MDTHRRGALGTCSDYLQQQSGGGSHARRTTRMPAAVCASSISPNNGGQAPHPPKSTHHRARQGHPCWAAQQGETEWVGHLRGPQPTTRHWLSQVGRHNLSGDRRREGCQRRGSLLACSGRAGLWGGGEDEIFDGSVLVVYVYVIYFLKFKRLLFTA